MDKITVKKIILYDKENFLEDALEQTGYNLDLNPKTISLNSESNAVIIVNDSNFYTTDINAIAYICPIIILGHTKLINPNPLIKNVTKPVVLVDLISAIDKAKNYAISLSTNIWLNVSQEILIKNAQEFETIRLTSIETKILRHLVSKNNSYSTKNDMLINIFGYKSSDTNTLETHISRLRKKIEPALTISHNGTDGYKIEKS